MTVLFSTEQAQPSIYLTKRRLKKNDWFWIAKSWACTTNVGFLKKLTLHVTNRFLIALHEQKKFSLKDGSGLNRNHDWKRDWSFWFSLPCWSSWFLQKSGNRKGSPPMLKFLILSEIGEQKRFSSHVEVSDSLSHVEVSDSFRNRGTEKVLLPCWSFWFFCFWFFLKSGKRESPQEKNGLANRTVTVSVPVDCPSL